MRAALERGLHEPVSFRRALELVEPAERDGWVDAALGLAEPPAEGLDLPRGCVPYLPCAVETLLHAVDQAAIRATDVFVDIGSGLGRAAVVVHLLTGAQSMGLEVQSALAHGSRELVRRLHLPRVSTLEGDANSLASSLDTATVFFLYCPFSGERLSRLFASLEPLARTRTLRICCVDLPSPACAWLVAEPEQTRNLRIYRSMKPA